MKLLTIHHNKFSNFALYQLKARFLKMKLRSILKTKVMKL